MNIKALLPLLSCLTLLGGCDQEKEKEFKKMYLSSCAPHGVPEKICRCIFDELNKNYSKEEINSWSADNVTIPKEAFSKVTATCLRPTK